MSPESPDLTVIDLPGIVRTATTGQSGSVIGDVNGLINSYLSQRVDLVVEGLYLISLALYPFIFNCSSAWPGYF